MVKKIFYFYYQFTWILLFIYLIACCIHGWISECNWLINCDLSTNSLTKSWRASLSYFCIHLSIFSFSFKLIYFTHFWLLHRIHVCMKEFVYRFLMSLNPALIYSVIFFILTWKWFTMNSMILVGALLAYNFYVIHFILSFISCNIFLPLGIFHSEFNLSLQMRIFSTINVVEISKFIDNTNIYSYKWFSA